MCMHDYHLFPSSPHPLTHVSHTHPPHTSSPHPLTHVPSHMSPSHILTTSPHTRPLTHVSPTHPHHIFSHIHLGTILKGLSCSTGGLYDRLYNLTSYDISLRVINFYSFFAAVKQPVGQQIW